ncbi:hypothetical protein [Kribbella ginsengisoli]|uniref:hypothetical protein n=1 Tax=Kribbella ginsengisoli TaxID=363865 RepID=UPI0031E0D860
MRRWGAGRQGVLGRHAATGAGGAVVAFFGLMLLFFGVLAGHQWQVSRGWDETTAVVDGVVVGVCEPGWYDNGSGSVEIRYVVGGAEYRFETDRDPGDYFFRVNDMLPVEYAVARPERGRAVWAVEAARDDLRFWGGLTGLCAVLGVASGVAWLVGRRRVSRR